MDSVTSAVVVSFEAFRAARAAARLTAEPVAEQQTFEWSVPAEAAGGASVRRVWDVLGPVDVLRRESRQAPHRARMLRHLAATALCSGHVPSE